jgi:hypothetical protein
MEEELHIERHGSSRKSKRFANKRERLQVKNYLKGKSPEDFVDETDDDDYNTDEEKNDI